MVKDETVVFTKYGQLYEGTFHSSDGNKVKVASTTGTIHIVDSSQVQTAEAYRSSLKDKA